MRTFKPLLDILPAAQRALWQNLAPCKNLGFVLYGGTAIALQLGHRASVDFDFFSHLPLDKKKEEAMLNAMPFLGKAATVQSDGHTRTYLTDSEVYFSFFGNINFGRVGTPLMSEDGILQVASLDDLMATKLAVVMQRLEAKDYLDIAALLRHGISLATGLACAQAIYGNQFALPESVRALTYFEGGDLSILSLEDKGVLIEAAKKLSLQKIPFIPVVSIDLTDLTHAADPTPQVEAEGDT
jgi:hypothetical protein